MQNDPESRTEGTMGTGESGGRRKAYEAPLLQELGSIRDIVKDINVCIIVN